jgi:uncharacterized protein (DUF934 family)
MSAIELESFLAAMEIVRRANAAALAVLQHPGDEVDERDHRLDPATSPTITIH